MILRVRLRKSLFIYKSFFTMKIASIRSVFLIGELTFCILKAALLYNNISHVVAAIRFACNILTCVHYAPMLCMFY